MTDIDSIPAPQPILPTDPNVIGELLRDTFFDQSKGTGCYATFGLREGVAPLPNHLDPDGCGYWTRAEAETVLGRVVMVYRWGSDGELRFKLPGGRWLVNTDCKKDYGWEVES